MGKTLKVRSGFGRWSEVWHATCHGCGLDHRVHKNWHGPTPRGAFLCGSCGAQVGFEQLRPVLR